MKKTYIHASYLIAAALILGAAAPAFANNSLGGEMGIKGNLGLKADGKNLIAGTDAEIQARAATQIDRRVQDLQSLQSRIGSMTRVSSAVKTSLTANITAEISRLNALKSKISTETGDALKADAKTIGGSYRIYMMVIPQTRILAAADRADGVANKLSDLSVKLDARIAAQVALGVTMTNEKNALADMRLKIADAKVQAKAAVDLVTGLTPDEKDKTKMAANEQAITGARAKLKIAEDDLKAAQADAKSIVGVVKNHDNKKQKDDSHAKN